MNGRSLFSAGQRWFSSLEKRELDVLLATTVAAASGWLFVEIAGEVNEGSTQAMDRRLLLLLRESGNVADPIGPRWFEEAVRDVTALGGTALLVLLSLAVVTHLALRRKPKAAIFVALSVTGALCLSLLLKHAFDRPRPDVVPQLHYVMTSSFPSGHSMLSASVYLTLAGLLARFESNTLLKVHLLSWGLVATLLVGVSRVYLGVHWPTDVLAGWAAGAGWASSCWMVARLLQRRGRLEGEQPTS